MSRLKNIAKIAGAVTLGTAIGFCGSTTAMLYFPQINPRMEIYDKEEHSEMLEEVYSKFDPEVQSYVRSVPIYQITGESFPTCENALAGSIFPAGYIALCPNFKDQTEYDQKHGIGHELLHMVTLHDSKYDFESFDKKVDAFYYNEAMGHVPNVEGGELKFSEWDNQQKLRLYINLYQPKNSLDREYCDDRYLDVIPRASEEFAQLGDQIIFHQSDVVGDWCHLTPEIINSYRGIIRGDILDNCLEEAYKKE